jgi:hypothetical protein
MKMKKLSFIVLMGILFASCTDNQRARNWGGTEEINLNENEVVLNVTWKGNEMWICTKDTSTGITYFREKSSWGVMEGAVILK